MKTYLIDDQEFTLKKSFTLNELDKIQKLFAGLKSEDSQTLLMNISNADIKEFLGIVLEPKDAIKKDLDFGNIKESDAAEVVKDFFLQRIGLMKSTSK